MRIRPFTAADAEPTLALFRHTVKTVNRRDYSEEEVAAWLREEDVTPDMWLDSFTGKVAFVAIDDNGALTGFVDCKPQTGLIDRLFVAAHRQGEGIGSALLAQAQAAALRFHVYRLRLSDRADLLRAKRLHRRHAQSGDAHVHA